MHIPFQDKKNPKRWRCSNCGSAVAKVWNFCQHCGEMIDWKNKKEYEMNNALKFEKVFGMTVLDLVFIKENQYMTFLEWLKEEYEEPKSKKTKQQSDEKSVDIDYNMLGFEDLYNYIGTPVFVIYPEKKISEINSSVIDLSVLHDEKRQWEVLTGLRKTESHEYVLFRGGGSYDWVEISKVKIYRNEDDANESA